MDNQWIPLIVQVGALAVVGLTALFKLNQYHMTVNSKMDKLMELVESAAFARGQKAAEDKATDLATATAKGEESVKVIKAETIETETIKTMPKGKPKS